MAGKFEYSTLAHRYTARYPIVTYVGTQVNFWILANVFLVIISKLQSQIFARTYGIAIESRFGSMLAMAVLLGFFYGICLGFTGYYLDRNVFRRYALGKLIALKTIVSIVVLIVILALLRFVFFDPFIFPSLRIRGNSLDRESWDALFVLLVIYYFAMTLLISFINQINKKYGPGILIPLLLGRYRHPKEQERIFMFMDLKSSTATAEKLGHLKYSSFVQDCFADINTVLYPFQAQVYQYVGDEIVVTWPLAEGLKAHRCIRFYFACKRQFNSRAEYFMSSYGFLPEFKAGLHAGTVSVVEIGEYKRDIAYHGDTLNTASRIQTVCNFFDKSFLASRTITDLVGPHQAMKTESLGLIDLKGKSEKVELVAVEWNSDQTSGL